MHKKVISISIISLLLITTLSARIKDKLPTSLNNKYLESNTTDTISYANNKNFKPAHSRITINQLAINFSKLFYKKYPTQKITVPINVVFQLTITESGEIQTVKTIRSLFPEDINVELMDMVIDVTADTWEPATYQGKKILSQITLPLTIFPKK